MYLKQKQPEMLLGAKEKENGVPQKDSSIEKKLPVFYVRFFAPNHQSKKFRGHVRDTQLSN